MNTHRNSCFVIFVTALCLVGVFISPAFGLPIVSVSGPDPMMPTTTDVIMSIVHWTFPTSGYSVSAPILVTISANNIFSSTFVSSPPPGSIVLTVLTGIDIPISYGPLPPGDYQHHITPFLDGGSSGHFSQSFSVKAPIPEPSTFLLLLTGLIGLLCVGWVKRKTQKNSGMGD